MSLVRRLLFLRSPTVLIKLVCLLACCPGLDWSHIGGLETFSGDQAVTRARRLGGIIAVALDIRNSEHQDINSVVGFVLHVYFSMRLQLGSAYNTAPECGSWTWINNYTSQRSAATPLGNDQCEWVRSANRMVSRQVLLLHVSRALCAMTFLENPVGSKIVLHPRMQELLRNTKVYKAKADLGEFGSPSQKGVWLYSFHRGIVDVNDFTTTAGEAKTHSLTKCIVNSLGDRFVYGEKNALKESRSYPRDFGEALHRTWLRIPPDIPSSNTSYTTLTEETTLT